MKQHASWPPSEPSKITLRSQMVVYYYSLARVCFVLFERKMDDL